MCSWNKVACTASDLVALTSVAIAKAVVVGLAAHSTRVWRRRRCGIAAGVDACAITLRSWNLVARPTSYLITLAAAAVAKTVIVGLTANAALIGTLNELTASGCE